MGDNEGDIRNDRLSNSPRLQYQQEETCGVLARNWLKTRFTIKYQSYSLKVRRLNDGVVNYLNVVCHVCEWGPGCNVGNYGRYMYGRTHSKKNRGGSIMGYFGVRTLRVLIQGDGRK